MLTVDTGMPSSLQILVRGTLGKPSTFCIMCSFSDNERGLRFMPVFDVATFKYVFSEINGKNLMTVLIQLYTRFSEAFSSVLALR